ncbi:serine O-acetyltransferase EpsC [Verrucomicrobium sp. BvORR034]|jgi:serine O-acetyltransferase|uniref:serine O-acetyltransferase EpsC n=1 Tax=Verrucomicrobium sp. BvORR034 TaxID=1396418 RepID=UPI000B2278E2|nr:serine O-acetyltransferase EpsC [Verrucomicrobium sp. BvORR034]
MSAPAPNTHPTVQPPRPDVPALPYSEHVPNLLASYEKFGGLNNSDSHNMPSKRAVGEICEGLLQLLFPGFHDEDVVHHGTLAEVTASRMADVMLRLEDQVRKSVRVGNPKKPTGKTPPILQKFCKALHIVREILQTDIEEAYNNDPSARSHEEIILSYPFIEAISIQRLAHRLYRLGAPMIPRMMTEWAHSRTGIDIHPGASIGGHFFIDHGTGIVIGETCRIGNNVRIYHGVTLGARTFIKDEEGHVVKGLKRHPDVEDNVTIYPNSTILGGETVIGANSTIGANVFLMNSVPPDSLVIYEEKQLKILDKSVRKNPAPAWSI